MADQYYKVTSAKDPFDGTSVILVEGESIEDENAKFAYVGGDPVELNEAQVEILKERFNVRSSDAPDDEPTNTNEAADADDGDVRGEGGAVSIENSSGGGGNPSGSPSSSRAKR